MIDIHVLLNISIMLIAIVALIILMGFLSKKYKILSPVSGDGMRLISGTTLGRKNKIILVEVLDRKILLGVSDQQINTLCVFDDEAQHKTLQVSSNE